MSFVTKRLPGVSTVEPHDTTDPPRYDREYPVHTRSPTDSTPRRCQTRTGRKQVSSTVRSDDTDKVHTPLDGSDTAHDAIRRDLTPDRCHPSRLISNSLLSYRTRT
jgi:hypothetical protein